MLKTNPGSPEAKRLGCTCPVLDNAYGKGAVIDGRISETAFFTSPDCPVHVDQRRLLSADTGGEGDSSGASSSDPNGDADTTDPVSPEPARTESEGRGSEELRGTDDRGEHGEVLGGKEDDGRRSGEAQ